MPDISIKNLRVEYINKKQVVTALDGFNATFKSGVINVIVGYSGCGKTTLLKAIAGLVDYDGQILFDDKDIIKLDVNERNVGFVSQEYVLYTNMTIFDNIAFPLKMKKLPRDEIIAMVVSLAKEFGIAHCLTRKPKQLSGGQKQRVALVRALVKKPDICLLDEPLSNVDEQRRSEMRAYIKGYLKKNNCTALYVTHNVAEAMSLADTLTVINYGKNEISGEPMAVYNSCNATVESLIKNSPMI